MHGGYRESGPDTQFLCRHPSFTQRNVARGALLLVARLGLKGAECLQAAARMVPENFLGKRVEFVAAIFIETSGQILPLEACEGYLSLLRRCSSYSLLTEPQKTMQQL